MKYLFITLKVQDGEHEHTHRVLTTCDDKENALKAADDYVSDYWGESDKQDDWYYFQGGTIAAKVQDVEVLTEYEYKLMSKIFSGEARPGYFQIVQAGYEKGLQREEVEINLGENGKLMLYKTPEGSIVDVYNQDDNVDTMTIWEDDLTPMPEEITFDDDDIKAFKKQWGQKHGELCAALGLNKKTSDDVIMLDYFWIEEDKKWYNKEASTFTEKEQLIANFLRHTQ